MADECYRLGSCAMIIARKVAAGTADFNAAIVSHHPIEMDNADIRLFDLTCTPTYVKSPMADADNQFYCTVVIDAILTIAIASGLWKSKTGWSHTDALIKRIIMYVL